MITWTWDPAWIIIVFTGDKQNGERRAGEGGGAKSEEKERNSRKLSPGASMFQTTHSFFRAMTVNKMVSLRADSEHYLCPQCPRNPSGSASKHLHSTTEQGTRL